MSRLTHCAASWLRRRLAGEGGSMIIDVVVSAAVLLMLVGATLTMLQRATEVSGSQRGQAVASNLAMDALEDVKSTKFEALAAQAGTVIPAVTRQVDGTMYTVNKQVVWAGAASPSAAACKDAGRAPETLRVTTTVSWPKMGTRRPVSVSSIVGAPIDVSSSTGAVVVQVTNRQGFGVQNLRIWLNGPVTPAPEARTDENGCVKFSDLPEGTYGVNFSDPPKQTIPGGLASIVNDPAIVTKSKTTSKAYQYDLPPRATVSFRMWDGGGYRQAPVTKVRWQRMVGNTRSGTAVSQTVSPAAPAVEASETLGAATYHVYAGDCDGNSPTGDNQRITNPSGSLDVTLPSARVTLKFGGTAYIGAKVWLVSKTCTASPPVFGHYVSDNEGRTPIVGLPWGVYDVCGQGKGPDGKSYFKWFRNFEVKATNKVNQLDITDFAGVVEGTCPL